MPRRKVCHVVSSVEGARWMCEQLRALRDAHGWDVLAVVSAPTGGLVDRLRDAGITVHVEPGFCNFSSWRSVARMPIGIWRLARLLRRECVDVVQSHLLGAMLTTRFAAFLADTPVQLAMYASPYHLEAPNTQWMDRVSWSLETALIPSCRYTWDICRRLGVSETRLSLAYYGPDEKLYDPDLTAPAGLRRESGWPEDTPVIVMVAYFYPRMPHGPWVPPQVAGKSTKGFEDLIHAAPDVLRAFPNAKIVFVGSGWGEAGEAFRQEMQGLVLSLGLERDLIFAGYRADTNAILKDATVAVQIPIYENVGGVIESLMMACPTVATSVGGIVDCVIDGETGLLVPPADPSRLAEGIIRMLADSEAARRMARNGRRLMLERFSLRRTAADLDRLYGERLEHRSRRGYLLAVSCWRAFIVLPILGWLMLRVIHRDYYVPVHRPLHRQALQQWWAKMLSPSTYWRRMEAVAPRCGRGLQSVYLSVRALAERATSHVREALPRRRRIVPVPQPTRLPAAIRWRNRLITAKLQARRRQLEFPGHVKALRDRFYSWMGRHAPGWGMGALTGRALARLRGRHMRSP